jgi:signal transduction histidine kinase
MPRLARRFEVALALRLVLIGALLFVVVWTWQRGGLAAGRLVVLLALGLALWEAWAFLGRTHRTLARFIEATRFEDFSQRFSLGSGGGLDELGAALDGAIAEMARRRAAAVDEARVLAAVVDDTPVPLLMLRGDDQVSLLNKAARRQFGSLEPTRLADLAPLGPEFMAALALPAAGRRLTRMVRDGVAQRTIIEMARVERLGEDMRIVSVLPVQKMLGSAELTAQTDLVRVLTHEIMNSLTPVTSLARTAADLLAAEAQTDDRLADVRSAVDIVARRAEGLHRFVESYRSFARMPDISRQPFAAAAWAAQIVRLFEADPEGAQSRLTIDCAAGHAIDGDPQLLAQVCLNLLRNGAQAVLANGGQPQLALTIARVGDGGTAIEVCDNGPGIPEQNREDVFMPFFTTKPSGNGVGLSFVRQVIVAHGGSIAVADRPGGGACLRMVF